MPGDMLKIIGGKFSGRSIASVPGERTRPPLARVRGAVTNILKDYIPGAQVLDLFAGTGSYSIELLSRGAAFATMIDVSPKAISVLRKNVAKLGLEGCTQIIPGDALALIPRLSRQGRQYDIILSAPPYFTGLDQKSMDLLGVSPLLTPSGIVVLQQHRKEKQKSSYGNLVLKKTYKYGDTLISTYLSSHPAARGDAGE